MLEKGYAIAEMQDFHHPPLSACSMPLHPLSHQASPHLQLQKRRVLTLNPLLSQSLDSLCLLKNWKVENGVVEDVVSFQVEAPKHSDWEGRGVQLLPTKTGSPQRVWEVQPMEEKAPKDVPLDTTTLCMASHRVRTNALDYTNHHLMGYWPLNPAPEYCKALLCTLQNISLERWESTVSLLFMTMFIQVDTN